LGWWVECDSAGEVVDLRFAGLVRVLPVGELLIDGGNGEVCGGRLSRLMQYPTAWRSL